MSRALRIDPSKLIVSGLLALVIAVGAAVSDKFGSAANFMNTLEQSAGLGFVSLGQTLVVLVGGVDLSVGAVVSAASVFLASAVQGDPTLMIPALLGVLVLGTGIGFINGFVTRRTGVHPLIVTLGMASILNGLVLLYTLQPTGSVPSWFEEFAYGRIDSIPVAGLVMLACFLMAWLFLRYTRLGWAIFAVGDNHHAATLIGLRTGRVTLFAYAACGLFAALAAVYFVSRTGIGDPRVGEPVTLASITPVVVGGTILGGGRGGVGGTLLGVFLISLLNNLLNYMNVSTFIQWVVQGLIIIVAVSAYVNRSKRL